MHISDLSKIDIKDIDFNKLKDRLLDRKDLLIQIGLVVVFLIIISSLFKNSQVEVGKFKSQMADLQSKTSVVAEYNKTNEDASAFLKEAPPPLSEDQIINFVTDLADKNNVKILTFSPAKVEDEEVLSTTMLQFSLETKEYKDMVHFIADIERSKNLLQIKTCTAQPKMAMTSQTEENENLFIGFRIEVVSVQAKI